MPSYNKSTSDPNDLHIMHPTANDLPVMHLTAHADPAISMAAMGLDDNVPSTTGVKVAVCASHDLPHPLGTPPRHEHSLPPTTPATSRKPVVKCSPYEGKRTVSSGRVVNPQWHAVRGRRLFICKSAYALSHYEVDKTY